uniref:Uncharacterized protein n=1 Tax=Rhizophora mucronata TaxID=61149 RepID=A0A2P2IT64_RHIMU
MVGFSENEIVFSFLANKVYPLVA